MHFNYPGFLLEILLMLEKEKGYEKSMRSAAFYIKHVDTLIQELREKIAKVV